MTKQTVKKNDAVISELEDYIAELEETLVYVRERKPEVQIVEVTKGGQMQACLNVFKKFHPQHISVHKIATEMNINERNVSTLMTYLRKGKLHGVCYEICTDSKKLKFIANL